jgi:hypothetical protein
MAKPSSNSNQSSSSKQPHLHGHAYEKSKALANLCKRLYKYNDAQFKEFCQRTTARINIPIWQVPSKGDLLLEPDFALRQFLWFIRPPETLEFLAQLTPLWPVLRSIANNGGT